jgi:hypothetical protein
VFVYIFSLQYRARSAGVKGLRRRMLTMRFQRSKGSVRQRAVSSTDILSRILREFCQMNSRSRRVVKFTVSSHVGLGQVAGFGISHPDALAHPPTITMSHQNRDREWDRGKDYWQQDDYSSWNDGSRGNTRVRDDDCYTEGKRRKYNNGVSLFVKPLSPLEFY